jgi:hypothetical protein
LPFQHISSNISFQLIDFIIFDCILKTFTKGGANSGGPPSKRPKISAPASSSKISTTIVQNLAESQSDLPLNYTLEAMTKKTPGVFHPFTRNDIGSVLIHGTVSRTASAQVAGGAPTSTSDGAPADANNSRYRILLRDCLLDTAVKSKRFVQPGGTDASGHGFRGSNRRCIAWNRLWWIRRSLC